jgi:hypothetical protein
MRSAPRSCDPVQVSLLYLVHLWGLPTPKRHRIFWAPQLEEILA